MSSIHRDGTSDEDRFDDPCTQIQVDLSAMLDGELDAGSVRRVMVHSDACPSCRRFLDGIRMQARSHRQLCAALAAGADELVEIGAAGGGSIRVGAAELRRQLTENARQLARIFYELGRGFVLMGISPNFSRIVQREPVPIPDMFQRGRNLLDEVERIAGSDAVPSEWMRARELFGDDWRRSPAQNLLKGTSLLQEALLLDPDFHEARIYLGHAHHMAGDRARAVAEFGVVLARAPDVDTRGFALLNLGNIRLEDGDLEEAERLFLELVDSGAIEQTPQFGLIYFNLALAYGMQERFDECRRWLQRLYSELPHKRRMIADEFRSREDFVASLLRHPGVYESLATNFPCWFPKKEAC
jgi:tetratricopeptide (TPR) repeat protein